MYSQGARIKKQSFYLNCRRDIGVCFRSRKCYTIFPGKRNFWIFDWYLKIFDTECQLIFLIEISI